MSRRNAAPPLRVLLVSLFHPELVRGGAQQICYELFQGLRETGTVRPFLLCAIDSGYPALFKSGAQITGFDQREDEFVFLSQGYDYWWHKVNEPLLVEKFSEFLTIIRPDVIHFHHFLLFGIDLVSLARRVLPEARIVFTFHEFLAICAADGHMVRRFDKSLCREASQVRCHQCFPERSPEQFLLRKMWFMHHLSEVDAFTCPSRFMVEHYVTWGIPREKIQHITNGQEFRGRQPSISEHSSKGKRNRFGFFGQLVDVKGVQVILRAVEFLRADGFHEFAVEINGDNIKYGSQELRDEVEKFLSREKALPPNERIVSFSGSYHPDQLAERMSRIDWVIVPSVWWEIFGLVISEAWAFGKPVICSDVGGMAERVTHEVNGLHFQVNNPRSLADTIYRACTEGDLLERLSANLPNAPERAEMVRGFCNLYRATAHVPVKFTKEAALNAAIEHEA